MKTCLDCTKPPTRYAVVLIWAKGHPKYSHDPAESYLGGYCAAHKPNRGLLNDLLTKFDELCKAIHRAPHGPYELIWLTEAQWLKKAPVKAEDVGE